MKPCQECGAGFPPVRRIDRFCCARCRIRWWSRETQRTYRQTPNGREVNRVQRSRHYVANRERELERQRLYDRGHRDQINARRRRSRVPAVTQARIRLLHADGYGRQTIARLTKTTPEQVKAVLDAHKQTEKQWINLGGRGA